MTTEPAFLFPEPELVDLARAGVEKRLIALGRILPPDEIEHDCLRYVQASIEAGASR